MIRKILFAFIVITGAATIIATVPIENYTPETESGTVTVLRSGLGNPYNLVVDSTNVYWIDGTTGAANSLDLATRTIFRTTGQEASAADDLALDPSRTFLYYTLRNSGQIKRMNTASGSAEIVFNNTTPYPAGSCTGALCNLHPSVGIAVPGNVVFADTAGILTSTVGGQPTFIYNPSTTPGQVVLGPDRTLAIDSASVYFVEFNIANATIRKVPLAGGTVSTCATGVNHAIALVAPTTGAGANSVFWVEGGSSFSLKKVSATCGTTPGVVVTLATGVFSSVPGKILAVDTANVYFARANQIAKVAINGSPGDVTTLVGTSGSNGIAAIAVPSDVNDTNVYWTSVGTGPGNGSIRRAGPR